MKSIGKAAALILAVAVFSAGFAPAFSADKPRVAVIEFKAKADANWYGWWSNRGASAVQDVMVTELVKSGKFRVIEREQLGALMREKNLAISGDVDPSTALKAGKLLGVKYLITGAVTEYGVSDVGGNAPRVGDVPSVGFKKRTFSTAINARLIDTETGEILWADDVRKQTSSGRLRIGGFGGGKDDHAMFDKVLKPAVIDLVSSLKAADI